MRNLGTFVPVFAVLAVACTESDEDEEASPPTGVWSYIDDGIGESTCGALETEHDPDTTFGLTNNDDGTFTVHQDTYGDFDCTIDGMDFECPERLSIEEEFEDSDGAVVATVGYTVSIEGTFSSDDEASGEQWVSITCEGQSCALAPELIGTELPCSYAILFHAEASIPAQRD